MIWKWVGCDIGLWERAYNGRINQVLDRMFELHVAFYDIGLFEWAYNVRINQVLDRMFEPCTILSLVSRALMKGTMLGGIKVVRYKI